MLQPILIQALPDGSKVLFNQYFLDKLNKVPEVFLTSNFYLLWLFTELLLLSRCAVQEEAGAVSQ